MASIPSPAAPSAPSAQPQAQATVYRILFAISLAHLFNDAIQAVIPAIFPILKDSMNLSYTQLGVVTFTMSFTSSIMQPVVGLYTDAKPSPWLLPAGMAATLIGMLTLGLAPNYALVLFAIVFVGIGSAVFHPGGARVAYMAAGPRRGLAQSIFQVGGNGGQALAPIMTALIFVPLGQHGAFWFTLVAAGGIAMQSFVAKWYGANVATRSRPTKKRGTRQADPSRRQRIVFAIVVLILLVFARSWYGACIGNYYAFYLMDKFRLPVDHAQYYIFCYLAAGAVGTFFGGPLADRFGRRNVIFFSMLGSAPFALLLPFAGAGWSYVLLAIIGIIQLSSFSVTVVYAQELIPGKIGTVSGLITGIAFGLGAIGAVAIGGLIDWAGLPVVMKLCGFLPLLGLLTFLLPSDSKLRAWAKEA